jgi:chromosome partitioning protein
VGGWKFRVGGRRIDNTTVIAVASQKGGCGKTTTVVNLGAFLAMKGKKVLLVDLDPQGNTTSYFAISKSELKKTAYDILMSKDVGFEDVIIPTMINGLDIVPAAQNLAGAEMSLNENKLDVLIVKSKLSHLKGYEYIIFDTMPFVGNLTLNAIIASDMVIAPIRTDFFAIEGVIAIDDAVSTISKLMGREPPTMRYLITIHNRKRKTCQASKDTIMRLYGEKVFESVIPDTVKLFDAPVKGKPICITDPNSPGARAYNNLADEVMMR